jgi:hypothetical protein
MKIKTIDEGILKGDGIPPLIDGGNNQNDSDTKDYGTTKVNGKAYSYKLFKLSTGVKFKPIRKGKRVRSHNNILAKGVHNSVSKSNAGAGLSKWKW